MSEHRDRTVRAAHDMYLKNAADKGQIIEAGFFAFRTALLKLDAPDDAVQAARLAYMAGAQHLFASIMSILDPEADPTERDLQRMSLIAAELQGFEREMKLRLAPAAGGQPQ